MNVASPGEGHGGHTPSRRWQVGLGDLIGWVVATALAVSLTRGANAWWSGSPPIQRRERDVGVVLVALAVLLCWPLLRQAARSILNRTSAQTWAVGWRIAAAGLLMGFAVQESALLGVGSERWMEAANTTPVWGWRHEARVGLWPICAALLMIGLVVGMRPGPIGPPGVDRGARLGWLLVPLAAVAGVVVVGYQSLMAYMVVFAIENVYNAMKLPLIARPGLWTRLAWAGAQATGPGVVIMTTAAWVASDLRRRDRPLVVSWRTVVPRGLLVAATVAAGSFLLLVSVPTVQHHLLEGGWMVHGPSGMWAIVLGFGGLAAGIAARGVAPPVLARPTGPTWGWWLAGVGPRVLLLGLALLSVLTVAPFPLAVGEPGMVGRSYGLIKGFELALHDHLPGAAAVWPWLDPGCLIWVVGLTWLSLQVLGLLVLPLSDGPAPFDALVSSRERMAWFVWLWSALTAVCLAALPLLFVAGLVVLHYRLHAEELLGGLF